MSSVIPDRVRERMEHFGHSQSALARMVGIKQPSINRLLQGEVQNPKFIHAIAKALQTSIEYLTGESDDPASNAVADQRLAFRHAPVERDPDLIELTQIDLRYGLGGTYIDGPVVEKKRAFSRALLRFLTDAPAEQLFWALGDGDSMEPTIRSGEPVLVDRSQINLRSGDGIWAFAWGDIGMIKRLRPLPDGRVEIHSDNPHVPVAIAGDDEIHLVGRVVGGLRRL